ncbi:MAG: hypothetical protein KDB00_09370, partial [Planctomycetales bacterium]|nr:hypothetical protein [Planctomycetales bacterium]
MYKSILLLGILGLLVHPCVAQETSERATINSSIGHDGTGSIVVEARGRLPEPPVFFTAKSNAKVIVGPERIDQVVDLNAKIIQGTAKTISIGLIGDGEVVEVASEHIQSWSVRREGATRFLDFNVKEATTELDAVIKIQSRELTLPDSIDLTLLAPGDSVGFNSTVNLEFATGVVGSVASVDGFAPLDSNDRVTRFQTATGGQIKLSITRDGAAAGPIEMVNTTLVGQLHPNGKSIQFRLHGDARVAKAGAEIVILSGNAAVLKMPTDANYHVRLSTDGDHSAYKLVFVKSGQFPVTLDFVATLGTSVAGTSGSDWQGIDFSVAAGAVVPLTLNGLESGYEFHRDQESVVPLRESDSWLGFLPATGRVKLQWKKVNQAGEGKLFFTTTGRIEARVGAGLLRQEHEIDFQVLQGELKSLSIQLKGPGEILDVQGDNIVGWKVSVKGDDRQLDATLSQPMTGQSQIRVRSQTPLDAFPVRVEGLRLNPIGAIRHSGYLRLTNSGSVRLEPTGLAGLTQLSPDQFPGDAIEARQTFVYRFPATDHAFTISADRIQPEVNVSELTLYELTETDRVIRSDIELDIREAPVREWDFGIASDYSVVSVTGASVADYIAASETADGRRNLKVVFGQDVEGRQLVTLHLEKSEPAVEGNWTLPRIEFPEAKSVRGDLGIVGAAGFRITPGATDLLVEKPVSYFPKASTNLQQAFRIRQPNWTATMRIEVLQRSVQADLFHLYSLSEETVYGSALINYFVTGSPIGELKISAPKTLGNVMVDGRDVRTWRREDDTLIVSLHQGVMGAYTLLVTFEEKPDPTGGSFRAGQIAPLGVQGERGYIQVVSPVQVDLKTQSISDEMLKLDPLELPAELRLLGTAPALGTWQYTQRPFDLNLNVNWFEPGTMVTQVVEFSEANSRVSRDGELVTDVVYFVKSRGRRTLKIKLPPPPVRLWEVTVDGEPVTARQADDATLIPLPGGTEPNVPIEVSLRLGKPAVDESNPKLSLPIVFVPVLKTQWNVVGDENRVLVPSGGTVTPPTPVLRPSGYEWLAKQGLIWLGSVALLVGIGLECCRRNGILPVVGLGGLVIAIGVSVLAAVTAFSETGSPSPLQLSLPILSAEETIQLDIKNTPLWRVNLSWTGLITIGCGIGAIIWTFLNQDNRRVIPIRGGGVFLIALGVLLQGDGAPWFFGLLAIAIALLFLVPPASNSLRRISAWFHRLSAKRTSNVDSTTPAADDGSGASGAVVTTILMFALLLTHQEVASAKNTTGFVPADTIVQQWSITHQDARLRATGTITLSGRSGDQFILLEAPAVLTRFEGEGLRLTKVDIPGKGLAYLVSIPVSADTVSADTESDDTATAAEDSNTGPKTYHFKATFAYQVEAVKPIDGIPVLTGAAAVGQVEIRYDEPGWEVSSPNAAQIESIDAADATQASALLSPGKAHFFLRPQVRDVTTEQTQFFVEASNLYLPGPGVVDGRHRLHVRTSQGQVKELNVSVPKGITVSAVTGPIGSWQFDADSGNLKLRIEPAQSQAFDVMIETQRGLDPLPADLIVAPLKVADASGEVGLVAIAFGPEAQPEKSEPKQMSAVNLGDFDASLIPNQQAVLHRVYRYGSEGGEIAVRVAPVDSEVRIVSKQVLSLGDERVVLGVNFVVEISRAGLFQLSFPLPDGLEVESLSGPALHHWAEMIEGGNRQIIMHLNGKTIGTQSFSLALSGTAPTDVGDWQIPHFLLNEASRQTGELVVRPTTGIRLRTVTRQNVSETDPRTMGGQSQGSLAFRLLQRDWNLVLGIEKLDPWVTGQLLHEVTLREGQTRTALIADFNVQNASIRSLRVVLPITDEDEIKTLRASGNAVSDLVRTAPESNTWEVQFKRRVVGKIDFRIEYERRGDRPNDSETLRPVAFPGSRQLAYFVAVRAGGRLELDHGRLSDGWQRTDWTSVPSALRESGNQNAPVFAQRSVAPSEDLVILAKRHSLADSLKLRVAKGTLTTILSPTGDQLTSVDVIVEVIQRSSLSVGLPGGGELYSIFVNGESVNSIR